MTIPMSPQHTVSVILPLDAGQEQPREFRVRILTCDQEDALEAAVRGHEGQLLRDWRKSVRVELESVVVGWQHWPDGCGGEVVFARDASAERGKQIPALGKLARGELDDLARGVLLAAEVGYVELKKSKSPPASPPG